MTTVEIMLKPLSYNDCVYFEREKDFNEFGPYLWMSMFTNQGKVNRSGGDCHFKWIHHFICLPLNMKTMIWQCTLWPLYNPYIIWKPRENLGPWNGVNSTLELPRTKRTIPVNQLESFQTAQLKERKVSHKSDPIVRAFSSLWMGKCAIWRGESVMFKCV